MGPTHVGKNLPLEEQQLIPWGRFKGWPKLRRETKTVFEKTILIFFSKCDTKCASANIGNTCLAHLPEFSENTDFI